MTIPVDSRIATGVCQSPLAKWPIRYNDIIQGKETHRDDLWAVSTTELNEYEAARSPAPSMDFEAVSNLVTRKVLSAGMEGRAILSWKEMRQIDDALAELQQLRRSLTAAESLIRKIAENPDCAHATCGLDCAEYLAKGETK